MARELLVAAPSLMAGISGSCTRTSGIVARGLGCCPGGGISWTGDWTCVPCKLAGEFFTAGPPGQTSKGPWWLVTYLVLCKMPLEASRAIPKGPWCFVPSKIVWCGPHLLVDIFDRTEFQELFGVDQTSSGPNVWCTKCQMKVLDGTRCPAGNIVFFDSLQTLSFWQCLQKYFPCLCERVQWMSYFSFCWSDFCPLKKDQTMM